VAKKTGASSPEDANPGGKWSAAPLHVMLVGEQPSDQEDRQGHVVATIHPSSVLRAPDSEGRRAAFEMLVADLCVVARAVTAALAVAR